MSAGREARRLKGVGGRRLEGCPCNGALSNRTVHTGMPKVGVGTLRYLLCTVKSSNAHHPEPKMEVVSEAPSALRVRYQQYHVWA